MALNDIEASLPFSPLKLKMCTTCRHALGCGRKAEGDVSCLGEACVGTWIKALTERNLAVDMTVNKTNQLVPIGHHPGSQETAETCSASSETLEKSVDTSTVGAMWHFS